MAGDSSKLRKWSDADLINAVKVSKSWRFFIVDGDLTMYLIPSQVIAGRVQILLRRYRKYVVGNAAGFMTPRPSAA